MFSLQSRSGAGKYLRDMKKIVLTDEPVQEKVITFRLDDKSIKELKAIAAENGLTVSSLARKFVRWAMESYEEQQKKEGKGRK